MVDSRTGAGNMKDEPGPCRVPESKKVWKNKQKQNTYHHGLWQRDIGVT